MTLKQIIIRELLDTVNEPAKLEKIFRRYSGSEGPFCSGLATAMSQLETRFQEARRTALEAESQKQDLQEQLDSLEEQRHSLEDHVQAVGRLVEAAEGRLAVVQVALDRAVDLERRGFGQEELIRLYEPLAQIAADQGAPPEEGVAQIETVSHYDHIVGPGSQASQGEGGDGQGRGPTVGSRKAHLPTLQCQT